MKKIWMILLMIAVVPAARAIYLGYAYPAGGKAGEDVELILGGQAMWGGKLEGIVTGTGLTVKSVERVPGFRPPFGSQRKYLLACLKALKAGQKLPPKPENTDEFYEHPYWDNLEKLTPLQLELVRRDLFFQRNALQMSPSINETAIVRLTIAKDAAPGERELRLTAGGRISNPVKFFVGDDSEVNEPATPIPGDDKEVPKLTIPTVLNGMIMPGEVDHAEIRLEAGKKYTFRMIGRTLQPFIGDGVPGHFQPVLELFDSNGKVAAKADDEYFKPDPVLRFEPKKSGQYKLNIRDALYRGRADFVYRLEIGEGFEPYRLKPMPDLGLPKREGTDISVNERLIPPLLIHGVIAKPQERRSYRIYLQKGETLIAEVYARRLDSPLDSILLIRDETGKTLCSNDDFIRPRVGETLQNFDSYLRFVAPAAGDYQVDIADTGGAGGADYHYYLRLDWPRPDFKIYVSPSAPEIPMVGAEPLLVWVERLDGFTGPIEFELAEAGPYYLTGYRKLESERDSTWLTAASLAGKQLAPHPAKLLGKAEIDGKIVVREARPGDTAMQAFAYTHLKPARQFLLTRYWKSFNADKFSLVDPDRTVTLKPNGKTELMVKWKDLGESPALTYSLYEPPAGVSLGEVRNSEGVSTLTVLADETAKPGIYALVVRVSAVMDGAPDKQGKRKKANSVIILPALRAEIGDK